MRLRAVRALLVIGGVAFGLYGYHLLRHDLHSSVPNAVASIVVAWTFLFAGVVAWARRPHNRMGILLTFVAYCLLERKLQYSHDSAVFTFGALFAELGLTVAFAHAVLAYHEGRLRTRFERWFIRLSYAVVVGCSFALLTVWDGSSKKSLFAIRPSSDAYDAIHAVYRIGVYGVLGIVFIALILRRVRDATPAGRRLLIPLMVAAVFAATRAVSEAVLAFMHRSFLSRSCSACRAQSSRVEPSPTSSSSSRMSRPERSATRSHARSTTTRCRWPTGCRCGAST